MKRKAGNILMILGAALIIAALSLFLWNQKENEKAGKTVEEILPRVVEQIEEVHSPTPPELPEVSEIIELPNPYDTGMTEKEIDGYMYVGYLTIPAIDLQLPVMSDWSYSQLKISPCRFSGSVKTDDMVICAHNYERHFGKLKNLSPDDEVYFTDMDGISYVYEVVSIDTLSPEDVEEMTAGDYDLTLFTCTYSGTARMTLRCQRKGDTQ